MKYKALPLSAILAFFASIAGANLFTPYALAMGKGHENKVASPLPEQVIGASCISEDSEHLCIGLKIVSYEHNGRSILNEAQAIALVGSINALWSQCNIGFQLENFELIDPASVNLSFHSDWKNDGDTIRSTFNDNSSFLIVALGTLSGRTIGVTEMPGAGVYGSLIEKEYVQNPLTVAHELGHYQGLYHGGDKNNVMSPYIGPTTSTLTEDQCSIARSTDLTRWAAMLRY